MQRPVGYSVWFKKLMIALHYSEHYAISKNIAQGIMSLSIKSRHLNRAYYILYKVAVSDY